MSDEEKLLTEDKNRDEIREELSQMSFEDLQKLKEKLGTKMLKDALFGKKKEIKREFKRKNKNRPREMSAKIPVSTLREVIKVKKVVNEDPRFNSLFGTFNEKAFKHSYGFLSKLRKDELNILKKELEQVTDPKTIKKLKYLIQRFENQLREEKRLKEKREKKQQEKKELIESIKRGEKPIFKKKSEKKILDLVAQYEELKETGKLKKHIKRLRKKNICKDKAKLRMNEIK